MDWTTTAFLFPGQGSQQVGMGADFAAAYPAAKQTFTQADSQLGVALSQTCFVGPEDALNDTINTQPALYVCSVAILAVLRELRPDAFPAYVAGHSLGEFSALTAAGALNFADGLHLVRQRGRLMKQAGEQHPGAMAALLGINAEEAAALCEEASQQTGQPVVVANDNCPGQVVISGDVAALDQAITLAQARGVKKAVRLAVSIAAHSPLMASAAAEFKRLLDNAPFTSPTIPVYSNADARPVADTEGTRKALGKQLTAPVRWTETIQAMREAGVETFIEIGAGDVLTGLVKRIDRKATRISINSVPSFQAWLESISA